MGSAVNAAGLITIENTCFLDNEFLRYAPVILYGPQAVLTASENYGNGNVTGDEQLACEFAIQFNRIADFENLENFECIDFDATECNVTIPTLAPVEVVEPSSAPSRTPRIFDTPAPTPLPTPQTAVPATEAPTSGATGRVIISLSAAAVALTAYFGF